MIGFSKYHGTGNDFILVDDRSGSQFKEEQDLVSHLCHRRFGIGADGLILLREREGYDFEMVYFNADGLPGSMCGNGGRCLVSFARKIGYEKNDFTFIASDGIHRAEIKNYNLRTHEGLISLSMKNVPEVEKQDGYYFLDTGSPHYVTFVNNLNSLNVREEGKKIRFSERFAEVGTNVNFVQQDNNYLKVRTYERGVEDETWSCGTGVTAAALVAGMVNNSLKSFQISTPGGNLKVSFEREGLGFRNIFLEGTATFIFDGQINL